MILRKSFRLFAGDMNSYPKPPVGAGVVFHGNMQQVKYALNFPNYLILLFSGFFGAMSGNFFYKKCIMRKNPPNPLRDPNEKPPEKHPHTPEEED